MIAWEMDARTRRFTRVSGRVEAVFGYPSDNWRSLPGFWVGILHPEDRRRVAQAVNRALRDREPCEIEYRALASDGAVVRIRDQVRVIADREGSPRLIQGRMEIQDRPAPDPPEPIRHVRRARRRGRPDYAIPSAFVHVRREPTSSAVAPPPVVPESCGAPDKPPATVEAAAGPAVRQVPTTPDRILASIGQAVIASDAEHRVVFWNRAAEALFGWTAAEAIGRLDSELVPARADASQNAEILAALVHGRPWTAEVVARTRDGADVPVLVSASAVSLPDGTGSGFVALITDLTGTRDRALLARRESISNAVAALGRAAGRELAGLVDRIETIATEAIAATGRPRDPADLALALEAIRNVADEAGGLALELRDAGRDRDGTVRQVDLGDLVRQNLPALELLAPPAVRVSFRIEPAPLAWLDPVAISQALLHFAADACAFMPEGGRLEVRVGPAEIFARRSAETGIPAGHYVGLEIRDTRAVLEPTDTDRWFDPAAGPEQHPLRRLAGHGLVRLCGAWILAESADADGNGLSVRVYFRVVRNDGILEH